MPQPVFVAQTVTQVGITKSAPYKLSNDAEMRFLKILIFRTSSDAKSQITLPESKREIAKQAKCGVWHGGGWIRQISAPEIWNFRHLNCRGILLLNSKARVFTRNFRREFQRLKFDHAVHP